MVPSLRLLAACVPLFGLQFGLPGALPSAQAQLVPSGPVPTVPPATSEAQEIDKLARAGQLEAALARADAHLVKNPRDAQVRFLRGVILTDQKKPNEAAAAFEALSQDFPELPEPYNNLAVLVAAQGRYEQARSLLWRAIEVQPNYVTAHENLGDLYLALAVEAYQRAAKLDPASRSVQAKLALAREAGTKLRAAR